MSIKNKKATILILSMLCTVIGTVALPEEARQFFEKKTIRWLHEGIHSTEPRFKTRFNEKLPTIPQEYLNFFKSEEDKTHDWLLSVIACYLSQYQELQNDKTKLIQYTKLLSSVLLPDINLSKFTSIEVLFYVLSCSTDGKYQVNSSRWTSVLQLLEQQKIGS